MYICMYGRVRLACKWLKYKYFQYVTVTNESFLYDHIVIQHLNTSVTAVRAQVIEIQILLVRDGDQFFIIWPHSHTTRKHIRDLGLCASSCSTLKYYFLLEPAMDITEVHFCVIFVVWTNIFFIKFCAFWTSWMDTFVSLLKSWLLFF